MAWLLTIWSVVSPLFSRAWLWAAVVALVLGFGLGWRVRGTAHRWFPRVFSPPPVWQSAEPPAA